ncbi:MAG: nitrile hydratase subunit alpha [Rhodospirillaceae bacterium]|nr:nitrile hydratase subunit alpha [Rhodospirillaceae bacterium]MYB13355.1 nitrile hydratase subunit alpha [Rhodospirillaceae bacterium]MYI50835.1 nitrile hydratase subunit alpha [Rhodospirillaceae bacterium]
MPHDAPEHAPGHAHDHDHAAIEADEPQGYYQHLAAATRSLLIEKGVFSAGDMRAMIEKIDERSPAVGARIVARAWTDPDFRERLLAQGKKTMKEEMDIDPVVADIVVVENTADVHNVVVCTLCSCYPVFILGRPPDWYKSYAYRSRTVRDPRGVLREFGTEIDPGREVRVHDSTADMRYLVLPMQPEGTEGWPEEKLAVIVTRDTMVGVAEAQAAG